MLIACGMMAVPCLQAVSDEAVSMPDSSGDKYVYRIEKKQEMLSSMAQDVEELRKMSAKDTYSDQNLSDAKYLVRLEGKLGTLVNEALNGMEATGPPAFRPIMPSTLMPESRFDESGEKDEGSKNK